MESTIPSGGGVGGVVSYFRAHIHQMFRHAHHETKDWLPSLGSRGGKGKKGCYWNSWTIKKTHKI